MANKKSQATVFIIIGLIFVIIAALLAYYHSGEGEKIVIEPVVDDVPEHFKVIQAYVLNCLDEVSTAAVVRLSENGGYIGINDPEYSDRGFKLSPLPTESEVVYFGKDHPVPYWWHMKSRNKCFECEMSTENTPTVEHMSEDLAFYVDKNLASCLSGFEGFEKEGFEINQLADPETAVTITAGRVLFQTRMPLKVVKGSSSTDLENFGLDLDAPLGRLYTLGVIITAAEMRGQVLEEMALNLITAYSGLDPEKLPPVAGFKSGSDVVTWTKSNTEIILKGLISSTVGLIQVEKTKGARPIIGQGEYENAIYKNLYIPNNESYENISSSFHYLDWPLYFDITPRSGEVLGPSIHRNEFPLNLVTPIETQSYEFFYDISYPVVVELRDDSALSGKGLNFLFALEGNVRDNKNSLEWHLGQGTIGQYDYSRTTFEIKEGVNTSYPLFDPQTNTTLNISFKEPAKSLFCDYNQRVGSEVKMTLVNAKTKLPISRASIAFGCGNYKTCPSIASTDVAGFFDAKLPVCSAGHLKINKDGYLGKVLVNISSVEGGELSFSGIELEPVRIKKASVKVIPIKMINNTKNPTEDFADTIHGLALPLGENENVMVTLTRDKTYQYEQDFFQSVVIGKDEKPDIKLVPGNYSLQLTFIDNNGVYIKPRVEFVGDELIKYPAVNMTPAMLGSSTIDASTGGSWEIKASDLEKSFVNFYVLRVDAPKKIEDMGNLGKFDNYSADYRVVILPTFS